MHKRFDSRFRVFIIAFDYLFSRLILYFCVWLFIFAFGYLFLPLRLVIYFCVSLFDFAFGCKFLHPYKYTNRKHTANRVNSWRPITPLTKPSDVATKAKVVAL